MSKQGVNGNPNGVVMSAGDNSSIGMPEQKLNPFESFSMGDKMRRGAQPKIFDNNGSYSKGDGGGTINHNGEYGPCTYGF